MTFCEGQSKKNRHINTDTSSAIGNAHHTALTLPERDSRNAAGSKTTICLAIETSIERNACPKAWKTDDKTMPTPASTKCRLIILSAVTPIDIRLSEALKIISICRGISCISSSPINMIQTAYIQAQRTVFGNPFPFPGAVIIAYNGNHTVIQAENGHKHKALQLEINAENSRRGLGKSYQDFIHAEHHHRAYRLHDYRRQGNSIDIAHGAKARSEPSQIHPHLTVKAMMEEHRKQHRKKSVRRQLQPQHQPRPF